MSIISVIRNQEFNEDLAREIKIDYQNNKCKSYITPKGLSILFDFELSTFTRSVNTGGKNELFEFMHGRYGKPKELILDYFNKEFTGFIPDDFMGVFARYLDKIEGNPQAEIFLDVAAVKTATELLYRYKGVGTKYINGAEMMKAGIYLKPVENESPYRQAWKRGYKCLYGRPWRESPNGDMRVVGHWIWNYFCSDPDFMKIVRKTNPVKKYDFYGCDIVPYRGYCNYKFLSPELKTHLNRHIEEVTELMFQASEFSDSITKNRKEFAKLMRKLVKADEKIDKALEEYKDDDDQNLLN